MKLEFIKDNYFEILATFCLTVSGLYRLVYSESRNEEMQNNILTNFDEKLICIFELSAIYFIFYANPNIRRLYFIVYIVSVLYLTVFYLPKINLIDDLKHIIIYTPNSNSIVMHFMFISILIYLIWKNK